MKDGQKTCEMPLGYGAINPLVRMRDGTYYEDLLCRDLTRYRSAVNSANLKNASAEAYILVDSIGITAPEVDDLLAKVDEGANLILMGEIGDARLLAAAGLRNTEPVTTAAWATTDRLPPEIGAGFSGQAAEGMVLRYAADTADAMIVNRPGDSRVVFSRMSGGGAGKGNVFYVASMRSFKREILTQSNSSGCSEFMPGLGSADYMSTFVNQVMPNTMELLISALLRFRSAISVSVDMGPYAAYELPSGDVAVHLENTANLFYTRPHLTTSFEIAGVRHFPIKMPSPAGYVIDRSTHAYGCQVNVLPDGVAPLLLLRKIE